MHFCVEGEIPEARMPGKSTITVHHQVFQTVTKVTGHMHGVVKSAAPVGKRVGKASEWNSFRGVLPCGGQATGCSPDTTHSTAFRSVAW